MVWFSGKRSLEIYVTEPAGGLLSLTQRNTDLSTLRYMFGLLQNFSLPAVAGRNNFQTKTIIVQSKREIIKPKTHPYRVLQSDGMQVGIAPKL